MLGKSHLEKMYGVECLSVKQIADRLACSQNKVTYWLRKHAISRRSISEAVYVRHNPEGNPFGIQKPQSSTDWFLYGLGLGLFWGEGNKASKDSVRLGNSDPALIRHFLLFLKKFYTIDNRKLRFGIQIFNDTSATEALQYWSKELRVPLNQFQKVVVTKSNRKGTYTKKSKYGVLTIYFSNIKLRDIIVGAITKLQKQKPS